MDPNPRTTTPTPEVERLLRAVSRRGLVHWSLSTILLLGLGLAVGMLYLAEMHNVGESSPDSGERTRLFAGLAILLVMFSVYALLQQRRVGDLVRTLLDEHDRATALGSRLSEISALFDVAASVHQQLELEPVLETITNRLLPTLEADEASIMLLDEGSQELRCLAVSGADDAVVREATVRMGEGIAGRVAESRQLAIIQAADMAERFPGVEKTWRGISSSLCVPLMLPDRMLGVLNVTRLEGRPPFTDEDARMLLPFAEHLSITIHRIGQFEALDRRATAFERMHLLRREFLCALNHELRNPLASVMGYAELLRHTDNTYGEQERTAFTEALREQAGRLLESVDDLHGLYSLEASVVTFETTPGSLNQIVRDSATAMSGRAGRKGVAFELSLDEELPPVWMDQVKLHTAIRHLVASALRSSARGVPLGMRTWLERTQDVRGWASLEIRITQDPGATVFSGGEGGDGHTDALGWGVLLIRELVQLHGGTLVIENGGDAEVVLRLSLPARPTLQVLPTAQAA